MSSTLWRPSTIGAILQDMKGTAHRLDLPGRAAPLVTSVPLSAPLAHLVNVIVTAGGRPIAVGGAIRDSLLGHTPKDVDVEVYGLPLEALEAALGAAGFAVHAVGRSFGVLKVDVVVATDAGDEREVIDVALPRSESKVGRGHKGFVVHSDPFMAFDTAAARRDFTINAIGVDLQTGEVLDPWGGVADLERGVLRHVSDAFDEDPLRVLRAAQFAARFAFVVDDDTVDRCRSLQGELSTLAPERIGEELKKLLLKGVWPSMGLQVLRSVGVVEALFPELKALMGCPQEPEWHPEGDVWVHTLMVVDEAARQARVDGLSAREHLLTVLAALCHDFGKPATTELSDGRIRSRDHESQGEGPTRTFCARLGIAADDVELVVGLVRDHLKPFMLWKERDTISDAAIRRLALRVPVPLLCRVATADHFGRTTPDALRREDPAGPWLMQKARDLAVADTAPKPILQGRDLQACGLSPGKAFGVLLKDAFEAQLEGAFADHTGALAWLRNRIGGAT
jgi:tRNA nucleotidyltransferase (CCA-adding enzyme)